MFLFKNSLLIPFFAVFFLFYSSNVLEAKRVDKVEICHWSESKQLFKKLSIPEPAVAAHLNNHDDKEVPLSGDCNASAARIFGLAYIDADQDGFFDDEVDLLIAKLEDTNGDDTFSAGDTLFQGNYPLNLDPCPSGICTDVGSFNLQEYVLTAADVAGLFSESGKRIDLIVNNFTLHSLLRLNQGAAGTYDRYYVQTLSANAYIIVRDAMNTINSADADQVQIEDPLSIIVDTPMSSNSFVVDIQDNYHINIEFDNPDFGESGEN